MISSSKGNCGSHRKRSVSHIRTISTRPRDMPAIAPMIVPTTIEISIAANPTAIEILHPSSIRASRSWPRSSVPNGCFNDGGFSRAPKSISLIATGHSHGPNTTPATMMTRIKAPIKASLCRLKRRHMSCASETDRRGRGTGGGRGGEARRRSAEGDARVEPAIEEIRQQVEKDDEAGEHERDAHDHRRVVGEDRADQQRADARYAKDLLSDDRAAEDRGDR